MAKREKNWCVYVLEVEEYPGRVKIGKTGDFPSRLYHLNDRPGLTHREVRLYGVGSPPEAENLESRLHSLYAADKVAHHSSQEYFDIGVAEISSIRQMEDHVITRLAEAEKNAPASLAECVRLGLVVLKALVYEKYERNGKQGHGGEVFAREMEDIGCCVPTESVRTNSSLGQSPWSGYVTIMPSASGVVSKLVKNELRSINRRKARGKISKIKPPKRDGSILTISCEAFRHLAPLVWPSGS